MSIKVKSIREFREYLNKQFLGANKWVKKGLRTKNRVLNFFDKNSRWPSRLGKTKAEQKLGASFENYVSKESGSYDPNFRNLAMNNGRKTNNKRKHNVKGFKKDILSFIKENGRTPSSRGPIEETLLRRKLDHYTYVNNDMTLLGKVYALDPCHKSGIPSKFRKLINESLDVSKPLVRLVK